MHRKYIPEYISKLYRKLRSFSRQTFYIDNSGPSRTPVAQMVKDLPPMQETQVRSLEEEMATHSSILAWRIPMDRGARRTTVHRVTKSWTRLSDYTDFVNQPGRGSELQGAPIHTR